MELLDTEAAQEVLAILAARFGFTWRAYWYPLADVAFRPVVAFDVHQFLASPLPDKLLQHLQRRYAQFIIVWEYELSGGAFWRIPSAELDFDWYSEKVVLLPDYSGLVYYSHEETIAFAGAELVAFVQQAEPAWESLQWRWPGEAQRDG